MSLIDDLRSQAKLDVYESSIVEWSDATYFMGRRGGEKFVGCVGSGAITGDNVGTIDGKPVILGRCDHANAVAIRDALPWAGPICMGLHTSVGLGDRLGLATPGHIRAVRGTHMAPILAQQSIREMTRTRRTPDEVMDAATWGVVQEGFRDFFGSDADHLQKPEDIDVTYKAGFTMFTVDPGAHVNNAADTLDTGKLTDLYYQLDWDTLNISAGEMKMVYAGRAFPLSGGGSVTLDEVALLRAAVKYGNAVAHTTKMYNHLKELAGSEFEVEVSVDETDSPTTPAEHYFFAAELRRLGVEWVSMAPRFIGRFEKGVDYIGDLDALRASMKQHVAVMRTLGPYKISIHSGSDKFSVYPIVAELAEGLVHLKTAGTSYLEALRALATADPALFRDILDFARGRYDTDKATYHVSAQVSKVPPAKSLKDADLPALLDDFDARQVLHCTFGSVLTADDGRLFRSKLYAALNANEEVYYDALQKHLGRHIEPFLDWDQKYKK